jgi:hypothetical protein
MLRVRNLNSEEISRATHLSSNVSPARTTNRAARLGNNSIHTNNNNNNIHSSIGNDKHDKKSDASRKRRPTLVQLLLGAVAAGSLLAYLFVGPNIPSDYNYSIRHEAQYVAGQALAAEHKLEREMAEWWSQNGHPKPPMPEDSATVSMDPRISPRNAASSWVEGESKLERRRFSSCVIGAKPNSSRCLAVPLLFSEKLKQRLKALAERQQQGKDIGIPVLTRWLGDDIAAWAGEGVNVEEWQQKVDEKYKRMRQDEHEWQNRMAALLERMSDVG